jgi:hypothetical protein
LTLATTARLVRRLVEQRPRDSAVLLLVGFLLAGSVGLAASVIGSAETALRVGLEADHAGRPYSVQAGTGRAADLLESQPGIEPVRDEQVAVVRADLRTDALHRVAREPWPFGVLLRGERPRTEDEVTVSEAVRSDLDLDVGDELVLESPGSGTPSTRTVSGVTVDPADRTTRAVVGIAPITSGDATIWLARDDPYANPELRLDLDLRAMTYTRVASVADERQHDLPPAVTALRHLPLGLGVLLAVVAVGLVAAAAPRAMRDASSLQAAGLSPRRSWTPILTLATGCLLLGEVAGFLVAGAVADSTREPLSSVFGQYWTAAGVPLDVVVIVLGATAAACALSPWPVRRLHAALTRKSRFSWRTSAWTRVAAATTFVAGAGLLAWAALGRARTVPEEVVMAAPVAAVVVGAALPVAVSGLVSRGCGAATTTTLRVMVGLMLPAVVGVATLTTAAGVVASRVHHEADVASERLGTIQAPGSLSLHEVPDRAAESIVTSYRDLGGTDVSQYLLPDERTSQGRVTPPGVVECVRESGLERLSDVPLGCYGSPSAPLNLIAASTDPSAEVLAAPEMVRDGRVGILQLRSGTDVIESVTTVAATPDPALGGNLPGLVVPEGFDATGSITLVGGGTRMMVLHDFGTLDPVDQSRVRATVARVASAAQVIDSSRGDVPSRRRAAATAGSLAVAAVAFALMLVAGAGAILGSRRVADALDAVGAGGRFRRALVGRMLVVPVSAMAVSAAAVAASNAAVPGAAATSFGATWPVPAAAAMLALALLAPWWLRVSDSDA